MRTVVSSAMPEATNRCAELPHDDVANDNGPSA